VEKRPKFIMNCSTCRRRWRGGDSGDDDDDDDFRVIRVDISLSFPSQMVSMS
jgi:hypothetical protein